MKKSNLLVNTITTAIFLSLILFSASAEIFAAPPANDNFANAQLISNASGQVSFTNAEATKETGEAAHAQNAGGRSVWFKYVAPGNGVLRLQISFNFNTTLAVYRGTSLGTLTQIAANDDYLTSSSFSPASKLDFGTETGATYYIAIDGFREENGTISTGSANLMYDLQNAAWNDNFSTLTGIQIHHSASTKTITTSNVGAGKQVGEPNINGNPGGKSVWFSIKNFENYAVSYEFGLEARSTSSSIAPVIPLFAIYTGESVDSLTEVTHLTGSQYFNRLILRAEPNTKYYIAIDTWDSGSGAPTANFTLTYGVNKSKKIPDFDRDGRADISVYRPTTGTFYALDSITNNFRAFQWGLNGDKPMFNDLDYDGKPDYYVFRPDTGVWYAKYSSTVTTYLAQSFGIATDIPLTLTRFNGGGVYPYITVFRPSTGTWWFQPPGIGSFAIQFGQNGDIPLTADFDGDGTDEIAVFRPSNGTWYIADPFTGEFKGAYQFGQVNDIPVPADFNGDGFADIAIFRPSTGTWWIRDRLTGAQNAFRFGQMGDKPQPADYDNDGKADFAVFRNGVWWILRSSDSSARAMQFGLSNDIPVTSPF